jgi:hypothetical protein
MNMHAFVGKRFARMLFLFCYVGQVSELSHVKVEKQMDDGLKCFWGETSMGFLGFEKEM